MDCFGPPSEPYSPSHYDGSQSGVESISSISELSEKPVLGRDLVSSDEEREAEVAAPIVGEELALALEHDIVETEVFRHVFSGCCHIARNANTDPDDGEAIQLKCGKLATKNFEKVRLAGNNGSSLLQYLLTSDLVGLVVATAMSLVDSTAVFEARATSIGVPDDVVAAMALRGWVSHGTYAFAVAFTREEVHLVAASRKRGTAAVKMDDSRPCEPVAKRKRLVTGCSFAEVHNVSSGVGDKESTQSPPKEHDVFAEAGLKDAEIKFSTSLETEYPAGLCKQLASAFVDRLLQQGKDVAQIPLQMEQAQRMGSGLQPRGGRAPLLLGDFKFKIDVTSKNVDIPSQISESVHPPFQGIPIHSKLISSRYVSEVGDEGEKRTSTVSTFGVFRSPFEFLHRALTLEHPLDNPHNVDQCNLKAILFIRDHSASEVVQFRAKQLKKYMSRAAQLGAEELQFKKTLDVDVRRVLDGKRLLLFKEMAADANVGDETLFQELTEGFRLTGEMPQSKQFPAKLKPAMISVQQLRESSVWAKKMIHSSCRRIGSDPEIAKAVFEETQQQLKDGWVRGRQHRKNFYWLRFS
ncbi:unnamed protein product [Cladocopium goreaui]|uniref:Uncharacterized protein n=1 Tax=Cladocopium goreaui TaxID=2562237 RepID=A0A9P1CE36_9DINO|nr:unnamed protein product [Cladocopium goreaui]